MPASGPNYTDLEDQVIRKMWNERKSNDDIDEKIAKSLTSMGFARDANGIAQRRRKLGLKQDTPVKAKADAKAPVPDYTELLRSINESLMLIADVLGDIAVKADDADPLPSQSR